MMMINDDDDDDGGGDDDADGVVMAVMMMVMVMMVKCGPGARGDRHRSVQAGQAETAAKGARGSGKVLPPLLMIR